MYNKMRRKSLVLANEFDMATRTYLWYNKKITTYLKSVKNLKITIEEPQVGAEEE